MRARTHLIGATATGGVTRQIAACADANTTQPITALM